MSDISDYIKIQWDDMHHSRNQDWRILQIIGVLFGAIIAAEFKNASTGFLTTIISLAIGVSLMGLYIATAHFIIFRSKLSQIRKCQNLLSFANYPVRFDFHFDYGRFGVQQMIMLIYVCIIAILLIWLFEVNKINSPILYIGLPSLWTLGIGFSCLYKDAQIMRKLVIKPREDKNVVTT